MSAESDALNEQIKQSDRAAEEASLTGMPRSTVSPS